MKNSETDGEIEASQLSRGRKLAEWVSLTLSASLIAMIASFLVYEGLKGHSPLTPVQIDPLLEGLSEQKGSYILPVRVANLGKRTLHELTIELEAKPDQSPGKVTLMEITYLGAGSERIVYFYLTEMPQRARVKLRPLSYQID